MKYRGHRDKNSPRLYKLDLIEAENLEIAEDLQALEIPQRPGYKSYLQSPEYKLERFLDSLDTERAGWK